MNQPVTTTSLTENQPLLPAKFVWPVLAILFLALNTKGIANGDIWFLLLSGRFVLENGAVPHHEFFMYTAAGKPEVFGGWGYGLVMELANRAFGIPAMSLLNAGLWSSVFVAAIAALRIRLGRSLKSPFSLTELAGTMLTIYIVYNSIFIRTNLRPEVTMYAVWFIGMLLFETGRQRHDFNKAQWIFPLLLWAEAWLHTAGILLLLLPAAYMAEDICDRLFHKRHPLRALLPSLLRWAVCLLACMLLPILNPNGAAQIYMHFLLMLPTAEAAPWSWLAAASGIADLPLTHMIPINNILEYRPAWSADRPFDELKLLGGFTIVLLLTSERRLLNCVQLLPLAVLGALHVRGLGLWALALFVPLASTLVKTGEQIALRVSLRRTQQVSVLILLLAGATLLKIGIASNGLRLPQNRLPLLEGTAAIRAAYPSGGNIFCSYLACATTAYVIGEKYKMTLGAHIMFMWPETKSHYASVLHGKADWREQLDRYNVIAAVVAIHDPESTDLSSVGLNLVHSPDWRLVAAEREAVSFVKLPVTTQRLLPSEQLDQIKRYWQAVGDDTKEFDDSHSRAAVKQAESQAIAMAKLAELYASTPGEGIAVLTHRKDEIMAQQAKASQ